MSPDFDSAIKLLLLFFERKKGSIVSDACKECSKNATRNGLLQSRLFLQDKVQTYK